MKRASSKAPKKKDRPIRIVHLPSTRTGFAVCGVSGDSLFPGHSIAATCSTLDRCLTCYTLKERGIT